MAQHEGQESTGGGNHRGSIFRLLIGTALIDLQKRECPTWGVGNSAPREVRLHEVELERDDGYDPAFLDRLEELVAAM